MNFPDENFVEFSNIVQDKIVGTKDDKATVSKCFCYMASVSVSLSSGGQC